MEQKAEKGEGKTKHHFIGLGYWRWDFRRCKVMSVFVWVSNVCLILFIVVFGGELNSWSVPNRTRH